MCIHINTKLEFGGLILCTEIISVHLDVNTRGKDPGTCSFIYISRRASSTKRTLRLLGLPWSMEFGICYLVRTMIGGLSWKHDLRASMKTDILELWKQHLIMISSIIMRNVNSRKWLKFSHKSPTTRPLHDEK